MDGMLTSRSSRYKLRLDVIGRGIEDEYTGAVSDISDN